MKEHEKIQIGPTSYEPTRAASWPLRNGFMFELADISAICKMKIKKPRNSNSSHLIRTHACGILAASQRARARTRRHLGHLQNENKARNTSNSSHLIIRRPTCGALAARNGFTFELADISAICKMKIKKPRNSNSSHLVRTQFRMHSSGDGI